MMVGACASVVAFGLGLSMPLLAGSVAPQAPAPATVMASYEELAQMPGRAARDTGNQILPESDGLYYLDAQFTEGGRTRFLIDTGASVTVLTGEDARRLGIKVDVTANNGARLRTAGGMTVARFATIARMTIAGRQLHSIRVAIIDNGLPVSLLGQNALTELGTITLGNGRMLID